MLILVHCGKPATVDAAGLPRCQECKKAPALGGELRNTSGKPLDSWSFRVDAKTGALELGEGLTLEGGVVKEWIDVPEGVGPLRPVDAETARVVSAEEVR